MSQSLKIIALGGIGGCIVCLTLATSLRPASEHAWSWSQDGLGNFVARNFDRFGNDDIEDDNEGVGGTSQTPVTREFAWDGSDHVELDGSGTLHYRPDAQWHLSIRGAPSVLDHLRIGDGHIGNERGHGFWHRSHIEVELRGPQLRAAAVNGSGKLLLDSLKQERLSLDIRGSGSVQATGAASYLNLNVMGSGSAELARLTTANLKAFIAGSGEADVSPSEDAAIFIAGSGTIRLHTHPRHLDSKVAGSGRIIDEAAPSTSAPPSTSTPPSTSAPPPTSTPTSAPISL
jgi:hypothetical protein